MTGPRTLFVDALLPERVKEFQDCFRIETLVSRKRFGCGFSGSTPVGYEASTRRLLRMNQQGEELVKSTKSGSNPFYFAGMSICRQTKVGLLVLPIHLSI